MFPYYLFKDGYNSVLGRLVVSIYVVDIILGIHGYARFALFSDGLDLMRNMTGD